MKRWWLVVALLLSLGLNLGLLGAQLARSRAQAIWRGERPFGAPAPGARLAERLRLEEPLRGRFVELQGELAEAARAERRELARLRRTLRDELIAPEPERARVERLLDEIAARQRALDRAFVDHVLAGRELLAGEQLERYLFFLERFTAQRLGAPEEGAEGRFGPGRFGQEPPAPERDPRVPGREPPPRRQPPQERPRP